MLDHGLDLEQLARDAIARGADCLGMAGGDGSQALVASIAIEHDLPFVCVSAGTRNHFALDLGLNRDDPRASMSGFTDAVERRVDYARVNGRLFVNNVSLGIYATVVQSDEYRDAKAATFSSMLPQLLGPDTEPFDLQFHDPDGREIDGAFLVMVSNNPYVIGTSLDDFQRRHLDTGQLGVIAVDAPGAAEAAGLVAASAAGLRQRSRYWHEFALDTFEIRSRSGKAYRRRRRRGARDGHATSLRDVPRRTPPVRAVGQPARSRTPAGPGCPGVGPDRRRPRPRLSRTAHRLAAMPTELLPDVVPDRTATTDPQTLAEGFLEALMAADVDRAAGFLSDDVVYTNVGLPTIRGRDRVARALSSLGRPNVGFEVYLHSISADGPVVLTERTDVIVVGRVRLQFWVWGRFDVHDGQITLWRDSFDFLDTTKATIRGLAGALLPAVRPSPPRPGDPPGR